MVKIDSSRTRSLFSRHPKFSFIDSGASAHLASQTQQQVETWELRGKNLGGTEHLFTEMAEKEQSEREKNARVAPLN